MQDENKREYGQDGRFSQDHQSTKSDWQQSESNYNSANGMEGNTQHSSDKGNSQMDSDLQSATGRDRYSEDNSDSTYNADGGVEDNDLIVGSVTRDDDLDDIEEEDDMEDDEDSKDLEDDDREDDEESSDDATGGKNFRRPGL